MAARPTLTVWSASGESSGSLALPAVFTAPIRLDVVQQVHSELGPISLSTRTGGGPGDKDLWYGGIRGPPESSYTV